MKILLIEPNIEGYVLMPTMSLAILKGYINQKTKHNAEIIDLAFHKKKWKESIYNKIVEERPDIIGLSVLTFNYSQAIEISNFIKKNFKIQIIFGGVHCILSPEEVIKNDCVDIICIGEGEYVLKDLLDENLNCRKVNGIWYKEKGIIIKNKGIRLIENLDEIPFPEWEDFELEKYFTINNNHLPIMGSRGCPYNCTYCSNHALKKKLEGKYVRFRSVDNILEKIDQRIKQYYGKGLKYLFFYDDTFILNESFVTEFCRKFIERGYNKKIKWNVNVRANLVTNKIIKLMKEAGCYEVRMGVEAGNDYIRNEVYKRNMSRKDIFDAIKIIKKNRIRLRLQFMIGAPYETIGMMKESFEMSKQADSDYSLFPILIPLPSTEIRDICEKEGLIEKQNLKNFQDMFINPVVRTKYASRNEIKKLVRNVRN